MPDLAWGDGGTLVVKSNNDLDAQGTNSSGWTSVRGNLAHVTGKWYCEIEGIGGPLATYIAFGVADDSTAAGAGMDTYIPYQCGGTRDDGYNFVTGFNNGVSYGLGTIGLGTRIGIAVDCDNQQLYLSTNGVWHGDPVAGTGARANWVGQAGVNIYPYAALYYSQARIHGDTATQIYPIPSGYKTWSFLAPGFNVQDNQTLNATGTITGENTAGLIAHWKLSDGSGIDLTGNSNDGLFQGGATSDKSGPIGNGVILNSTGDYVANDQVINIPYVSISVWVKPVPSGRNMQIVGFANGFASPTTDKDLFLNSDGTIGWYVYVGGGTLLYTTTTITDGKWHHVVATYEEGGLRIYIDSVLSATTQGSGGSFAGYGQPNVFLGGVGHPNAHGDVWYVGELDDFRLYNRALPQSDVSYLYYLGVPAAVLSVNQAPQILAATASSEVHGALIADQAGHIVTAHGGTIVTGALAVIQDPQMLAAIGGIVAGGTLSALQANQTVTAIARITVSGALALAQTDQHLVASVFVGHMGITQDDQAATALYGIVNTNIATLNVTQAPNTIDAAGGAIIIGRLAETQAQTLASSGIVSGVVGALTVVQAPNTIVATSLGATVGTLIATQARQTLIATGVIADVIGTLTIPQDVQRLSASALATGTIGRLYVVQDSQTSTILGGPVIVGILGLRTTTSLEKDTFDRSSAWVSGVSGAVLDVPPDRYLTTALPDRMITAIGNGRVAVVPPSKSGRGTDRIVIAPPLRRAA